MQNLKNQIALLLPLILSITIGHSQQLPFYSHHVVNPYFVNPAFAGENGSNVFIDYRKQWIGLNGAPEYQLFTFEAPLKRKNMGFGVTFSNDVNNVLGSSSGLLSYSYVAKINKLHQFRFGVSLGFRQNRILFNKINAADMTEAILFSTNQNASNIDGNFGINYKINRFQLGFATYQVFNNSYFYEDTYNNNELISSLVNHYIVVARYKFIIIPKIFTLSPIILGRSAKGIPFQYDGNIKLDYKEKSWINIAYKHEVGYSLSIGTHFENFIIGYSYEMSSNKLVNYNYGSHEVLLGVFLNKLNSNNGIDKKLFEKLESHNYEILEKIDYLEKDNKRLKIEYEKAIKEYIFGLDSLKKAIKKDEVDLKNMIKDNEVILNNNNNTESINNQQEKNNYNNSSITNDSTIDNNTESINNQQEKNNYNNPSITNDSTIDNNKEHNNKKENDTYVEFSKDSTDEIVVSNKINAYYIIVGAVRDIKDAKNFQNILIREYQLKTKVIKNSKDTWYLIYSDLSKDKYFIKKELQKIIELDSKSIFIGKPWIYAN